MEYPKTLLAIIEQAAKSHRNDIEQAVSCAEKAWLASPEHADWIAAMVRGEIRSLIHDSRHRENVAIRREVGVYGGPAKVTVATGAVARVARNCLVAYSICGVALGKITGKQLLVFADHEQEKAAGYAFNARLCRKLAELVPADKTVAQCVSVSQVRKIMREVSPRRKKATVT